MDVETIEMWCRYGLVWGPWFFETVRTESGRRVFDCLCYEKRDVFIVTFETSSYGEINDYKAKLEKLGHGVAITTQKDLKQFITDEAKTMDVLHRAGIDYYLIGALNRPDGWWETDA